MLRRRAARKVPFRLVSSVKLEITHGQAKTRPHKVNFHVGRSKRFGCAAGIAVQDSLASSDFPADVFGSDGCTAKHAVESRQSKTVLERDEIVLTARGVEIQ